MNADLRERYTRELMKALDRLEEIQNEKKEAMKSYAASIEAANNQIHHWRNLLAGRKGEQLELAPPEKPEKKGRLQ